MSRPPRAAAWASVAVSLALAWVMVAEVPVAETSVPVPPPSEPPTPVVVALATVALPPPPAPESAAPPTPEAPQVAVLPDANPKPAELKQAPNAPIPETRAPHPEPVEPTTVEVREGRALLRQMEIGDGPSIEIAWPASAQNRARLYDRFVGCHGMVTAVLGQDGRVYRSADAPGTPWDLNPDRYSGFVREAAGDHVAAEADVIFRTQSRHGLRGGLAVRLFPRTVDAAMLGGLRRLVGTRLMNGGSVRARYRLDAGRVIVAEITVDGEAVDGSVAVGCAS